MKCLRRVQRCALLKEIKNEDIRREPAFEPTNNKITECLRNWTELLSVLYTFKGSIKLHPKRKKRIGTNLQTLNAQTTDWRR